jgi:signal transduction histidine kinase
VNRPSILASLRALTGTLTGRMVIVTLCAVLAAYALAFALFASERGTALRRATESGAIERVVSHVERLRASAPEDRGEIVATFHERGMRLFVTTAPVVTQSSGASGTRWAREIAQSAEARVFAQSQTFARSRELPPELRDRAPRHRAHMHERFDRHAVVLVRASIELGPDSWLNVVSRHPGPQPPPLGLFIGAVATAVFVGLGAALVGRQVGRPLSRLTEAARALGAGELNTTAPVAGPEDVRRAASAFNAMASRLGGQLSRQRQMLWALSHDLRTPITALRLRAELIDDEATRQRMLASIAEIERLTEQALALARAGASEEPRATVDLADIARTLCGELQDIGLAIRADANAPINVECRPGEIVRAARNLAENAAKHGGGGVMRVYRNDSGEAVLEVLDEGRGVPATEITKLTAPFYRADAARGDNAGAGLGLAIAQAIVEAHGGRLELANRQPRGFSATLIFPA